MTYKVSVILPCYNGAKWISQAIKSVLLQTYENFELIIIDDGSTDNSKDIINSYLKDKRIQYIYQSNRGFSAAVNRGIKEADGNLIGFIGQDDLWLPKKLEVQIKYLEKHPNIDLIFSNYVLIDAKGQIIGITNMEVPNVTSREKLIESLFLKNFIGFETVLVRRECFCKVGLFDESMVGFSDHDMWLRIAGEFNISGFIEKPLVMKRVHEFQLTKVRLNDVFKDELTMVRKTIIRYPFLKKVKSKKMSLLYYAWGTMLLEKGDIQGAKEKFLRAIKHQPWKVKAIAAYASPRLYARVLKYYKTIAPQFRRVFKWIED